MLYHADPRTGTKSLGMRTGHTRTACSPLGVWPGIRRRSRSSICWCTEASCDAAPSGCILLRSAHPCSGKAAPHCMLALHSALQEMLTHIDAESGNSQTLVWLESVLEAAYNLGGTRAYQTVHQAG